MTRQRARPAAALTMVAATGLAGCTLIGFGIGRAIDKRHDHASLALRGVELVKIEPGTPVHVFYRDGTDAAGKFEGLAPASSEYGARYGAAREVAGPAGLPGLGQRVEIEKGQGKVSPASFTGFEPGAVLLTYPKEAAPRSIPFGAVTSLRWSEGTVDGDALTARMFAGRLPFQSRLVMDGQKLALESVERIERPDRRRTATKIGALIGAALDIVVVAAVLSASSSDTTTWDEGSNTSSSCPFVYAWDGQEFHREAEMYGGAILRTLARTDRVALAHLKAVHGRVRLRVTNEQGEIDYLDRFGVVELAVPDGARVTTTPDGGLDVLRAPTPPLAARDRTGRGVREALLIGDGQEWTSDPFTLDPETEGTRDEIALEFERPPGSREVALAFTLHSTPWGAGLLTDLLRLQGRDLNLFYARLEEKAAERARFVAALAREGLPRVEVFDGRGWRAAGILRNLGPVEREQAVRVPLVGIPGDVLRVRLSAPAGMWSVDRVAADFTPRSLLETRSLRLLAAHDERNASVAEAIERADGQVHTLPPWSSSVELEFDAGPDEGPGSRAFAVEATGHYRILLPPRGEPQRELFAKLVDEPGAFGRYSLAALRSEALRQGATGAAP